MNKLEFEKLIKPLIEIYDEIELELINQVLEKLKSYQHVQGSLEWYIDKLNELKTFEKNNLKIMKSNKRQIEKVLKEILTNSGTRINNLDSLKSYYEKGIISMDPTKLYKSNAINNLISEAYKECKDITELINTKAIEGLNATYRGIINKAYLETASGVYTYTESIRRSLKDFAKEGIKTANYESGRSYSIESAIRRDVVTRVNKLVGDCEIQHAKDLNTNLVYVDQHLGARTRTKYTKEDYEVHVEWQGKKYMIVGSNDKYDNLYEKTGYGKMLGLKGINCYHNMRPTWEWEKIEERIDEKENAKKYEQLQEQRNQERNIRALKRKMLVVKDEEDLTEYKKVKEKLEITNSNYSQWLENNNLTRDYSREYVDSRNTIQKENYINITDEWLENAQPNSHVVKDREYFVHENQKYEVDNKNVVLDYSNKEKEVAEWLEDTFGGEVYMLPRINSPKSIKTADYLFKNEYWDLKEITGSGKNTLDSAIKKKKGQSNNFIFDINDSEITIESVSKQIERIYKNKERRWVDKIMVKQNKDVVVINKRK
jgi:hypothetical protein|nr:MAG TPA: minor capsid protein [Caudoviricetes sp.]